MKLTLRYLKPARLAPAALALLFGLAAAGEALSQEKGKKKANDPFVEPGEKAGAAERDPFAAPEGGADEEREREKQIGILVEYIELDHAVANRLVREHGGETDVTGMRDEVQRLVDDEAASIVVTAWVIARSGQRAKVESVSKIIYATEFNPPEIPQRLELDNVDTSEYLGTPPTPSAFETQNVGVTLEVDPVLGADGKTIDLNLVPELVLDAGERSMTRLGADDKIGRVLDSLSVPEFYTLSVSTAVTTIDGQYVLIGVLTPKDRDDRRILVFVKARVLVV